MITTYVDIVGSMKNEGITKEEKKKLYNKNTFLLIIIAIIILHFRPSRITLNFVILIALYISFIVWSYWIIFYRKSINKLELKSKKSNKKSTNKKIKHESSYNYSNRLNETSQNVSNVVRNQKDYSDKSTSIDNLLKYDFLKWCNGKCLLEDESKYPQEFSKAFNKDAQQLHQQFINEGLLELKEPWNELSHITVKNLKEILRYYNKKITHKNKSETIKFIVQNIPSDQIYDFFELKKIYMISEKGKDLRKLCL